MEAIDDAPRVEAQIATEIDDQAAAEKEKENAAAQRKAGDVDEKDLWQQVAHVLFNMKGTLFRF